MNTTEDILYHFAVEPNHDRATLERYLRQFPDMAMDIVLLSFELSRPEPPKQELSAKDHAMIKEAWKRYAGYALG